MRNRVSLGINMTAVLAFLAFIMAFGAIWFTAEALKRIDARNDVMLKPHLRKITASVDKNHETLLSLMKRLEQIERQVKILKLKADLPPGIERETASIHSGLDGIHRYSPSIRLNG